MGIGVEGKTATIPFDFHVASGHDDVGLIFAGDFTGGQFAYTYYCRGPEWEFEEVSRTLVRDSSFASVGLSLSPEDTTKLLLSCATEELNARSQRDRDQPSNARLFADGSFDSFKRGGEDRELGMLLLSLPMPLKNRRAFIEGLQNIDRIIKGQEALGKLVYQLPRILDCYQDERDVRGPV